MIATSHPVPPPVTEVPAPWLPLTRPGALRSGTLQKVRERSLGFGHFGDAVPLARRASAP